MNNRKKNFKIQKLCAIIDMNELDTKRQNCEIIWSKYKQASLIPELEQENKGIISKNRTSTFVDNMQLPIHRWFRYSAGFSAEWVKEVVSDFKGNNAIKLFDPFVGSGTTVLAGEECGIESLGIEAHPFVARIAKAKLLWSENVNAFRNFAMDVLQYAQSLSDAPDSYPNLIHRCYSEDILNELDQLRRAWLYKNDDSAVSELTWLALVGILRVTSSAGTAPWQYVLPKKTKKGTVRPYKAFYDRIRMMSRDMLYFQSVVKERKAKIFEDDARACSKIENDSIDLIITSPPYTNNYDYADATRLEMSFFGEIKGWGDLQRKVRRLLVRSCSQHASAEKNNLDRILTDKNIYPIIEDLREVCHELERERLLHGGRKTYHLMVAAYFSDLAKVWISLRKVCKKDARVCFVVGDSAPYGIYVPVDKWLGELAISAGFESYYFEKTRDRNVKWKNRKHKVPLHEGRLWVEG
jgi:DNA modification methylase